MNTKIKAGVITETKPDQDPMDWLIVTVDDQPVWFYLPKNVPEDALSKIIAKLNG